MLFIPNPFLNRWRTGRLLAIGLVGLNVLTGCGATHFAQRRPVALHVQTLVIKPPQFSQNPLAALGGISWVLSNGHKEHMTSQDVWFVSTFLGQSIASLDVPNVQHRWSEYFILLQFGKTWQVIGAVDMPWAQSQKTRNSMGLALPFTSFISAKQAVQSDKTYWFFERGTHVIFILREPRVSVNLQGWRSMPTTTTPIYVRTRGVPVLLNFSNGYLIAVGGNVTAAQLRAVWTSLPPATASGFPYRHS